MVNRKIGVLLAATVALMAAIATSGASASSPDIQVVADSSIHASTATIGGATALSTTRTVENWHGAALNPDNGVTYGFNMVGKDPSSGLSSNIATDVIPIKVVIDGFTFDGSDVLTPTLNSPQFVPTDFSTTPHSTVIVPDEFLPDGTLNPAYDPNGDGFGSGGALSAGNTSNQLEDATMRSQFNNPAGYHVNLSPVTPWNPITIVVPRGKGTVLQSIRGVIFGDVNIAWWAARLQSLNHSLHVDPTHLPIYLTDNVMLFIGNNPFNCCVIGFHGAGIVPGNSSGGVNGNGNQPVQTYAWASYVTPGVFNPQYDWALQDIHALSHEISEWADDPFVNNYVEPWLTPTAPQYGCTGILETGDPVVGIGFSAGTNSFRQVGAISWTDAAGVDHTINTTDGMYHPEDEALLPWFMRTAPNTTSQPTQSPSTNVGRYTFMGDLNPYPGFRAPATGC